MSKDYDLAYEMITRINALVKEIISEYDKDCRHRDLMCEIIMIKHLRGKTK